MYSTRPDGRRFKVKEAKDWEEEAGYLLLNCQKYGAKKVVLSVDYFFKDNRSDLGNRTKILQDLLQKQGIIDNDSQVYERHEYKTIENNNPRVEIQLIEFNG